MDKQVKELVQRIQEVKKTFIPPKKKMEESIENDTRYLMALSNFIHAADKMVKRYESNGDQYNSYKTQIEIFDAVGKLQANQGLVNDKMLHYEKVFLPMYEKDMKEMEENFESTIENCKNISAIDTNNEDENKIINYIKSELKNYLESELVEDQEFKLHSYKILKRLNNKHKEIEAVKAMVK